MFFKKFLYNFYYYGKYIGYLQTLYYFYNRIFNFEKVIKINIKKDSYLIRPAEHDMEVLISNLNKEYEILTNLKLPEDQLIVDAGAYIGTSSIRFSQIFKQNKIIAIEPFEENYNIMTKNIGNYKNIIPINSALVSKNFEDEVYLYKSKTGAWGNNILKNTHDKRNLKVIKNISKINLEDLIRIYKKKIFILKLDIEGSEKMIIENDKDILNDIDIIILELHSKIHRDIDQIFFSFASNRYNFSLGSDKILSLKKVTKN